MPAAGEARCYLRPAGSDAWLEVSGVAVAWFLAAMIDPRRRHLVEGWSIACHEPAPAACT